MSALLGSQDAKPQEHLRASDENRYANQDDDDPGNSRHLVVGHIVCQHFCQVQKDATPFIENLNPRFDLEVFCKRCIQRMQGGFVLPDEVRCVENVRCCSRCQFLMQIAKGKYSHRLTSTRLLNRAPSSFMTSLRSIPNSPVLASRVGTSFAASIWPAIVSSKKLNFVL